MAVSWKSASTALSQWAYRYHNLDPSIEAVALVNLGNELAHKNHIIAQVEDKLWNPLDVVEMSKLKADLYSHIISLVSFF